MDLSYKLFQYYQGFPKPVLDDFYNQCKLDQLFGERCLVFFDILILCSQKSLKDFQQNGDYSWGKDQSESSENIQPVFSLFLAGSLNSRYY